MYEQPPGGPQYPPYGQPPQRTAWPWVLLGCAGGVVFMVLLFVGCTVVLLSDGPDPVRTTADDDPGGASEEPSGEDEGATEEEPTVGIGEPGDAGQWEVTVDGISSSSVHSDGYLEEQAQGEFQLLDLTVENISDEAGFFDEADLTLVDDNGNSHAATSSLGAEGSLFYEQVNPGNQVTGVAVFDVPEGTDPATLEVRTDTSGPLEISLD
ncbi:DUF4352 domain-containing protein [Nocardiopsis sp. NPDC058631]|uniref:DUF4352 domain-containing protein n=1 Tax=Nocardiopsis sp. NPDC058631 TaxID=3346566 RepID=UPI00365DE8AE